MDHRFRHSPLAATFPIVDVHDGGDYKCDAGAIVEGRNTNSAITTPSYLRAEWAGFCVLDEESARPHRRPLVRREQLGSYAPGGSSSRPSAFHAFIPPPSSTISVNPNAESVRTAISLILPVMQYTAIGVDLSRGSSAARRSS